MQKNGVNEKTIVSKDNELVQERCVGFSINYFLYYNWFGRLVLPLVRMRLVSRLFGWYQSSFLSRWYIKRFIKKYDIVLNDFVIPEGGFSSFNDFFIRKIKPGARSVNFNKNVFVSPVDGNLLVVPELSKDIRFFVKSKQFSIAKFIGDEVLANEYEGGTLLVFRLTPHDYHRYHFPCDTRASESALIRGKLDSVHPLVYRTGVVPLQENERQRVILDTMHFGKIVMGVVGALLVGRVCQTYEKNNSPHKIFEKGEEMGYFSFGGSTIGVMLKKNILSVDEFFVKNSKKNIETVVKMGQRVGQLITH